MIQILFYILASVALIIHIAEKAIEWWLAYKDIRRTLRINKIMASK